MRRERQNADMPGSQIDICIRDENWRQIPGPERFIRKIITAAQGLCETPEAFEMSIVLDSDLAVQALNRDFRGKDAPTNVLSFPGYDGAALLPGQPAPLGDIILAHETLTREAGAQGKSLEQHLAHLLIHGFLHLLGYTHENDSEARIMEAKERAIMQQLGFPDPYIEEHEG